MATQWQSCVVALLILSRCGIATLDRHARLRDLPQLSRDLQQQLVLGSAGRHASAARLGLVRLPLHHEGDVADGHEPPVL